MLDGIVFGGIGGIVTDGHRDNVPVAGLSLDSFLPKVTDRAVAAIAVGQDQQSRCCRAGFGKIGLQIAPFTAKFYNEDIGSKCDSFGQRSPSERSSSCLAGAFILVCLCRSDLQSALCRIVATIGRSQ